MNLRESDSQVVLTHQPLCEVLVVDPHQRSRDELSARFRTWGWNASSAETGAHARVLLAASARPRIVVLSAKVSDIPLLDVLAHADPQDLKLIILCAAGRQRPLLEHLSEYSPQFVIRPIRDWAHMQRMIVNADQLLSWRIQRNLANSGAA